MDTLALLKDRQSTLTESKLTRETLEDKLLKQLADRDETHRKELSEKEESFDKELSD